MSEAQSLGTRLLRKKPIETLVSDTAGADSEHGHLKRGITPFQLTMFGVGSTTAPASCVVLARRFRPPARRHHILHHRRHGRGPDRPLLCGDASMIPVSGSSYSYAYATLAKASPTSWRVA